MLFNDARNERGGVAIVVLLLAPSKSIDEHKGESNWLMVILGELVFQRGIHLALLPI